MTGWPVARQCAVAWRASESSQQPMCPQVAQRRRWNHQPPAWSHSAQPAPLGGTDGSMVVATLLILARWRAAADSLARMAVRDSREVVIEASSDEVLDVIADVESSPQWSPAPQNVEIVEPDDEGRPHQVKRKVRSAGIT